MCLGGIIYGRLCCEKPQRDTVNVPLVGVKTTAQIVSYTAEVTLRQRFENVEKDPIEAIYNFPLPENAAVCSFEAFIDGRNIEGIIKEKEKAHETYDDAISAGYSAFLLEEVTEKKNVFQASIGNLPPQKEVIIIIKYVVELNVASDKSINFSLITSQGHPSSKKHEKFHVPLYTSKETENFGIGYGLNVEIFLDMSSPIKTIHSETHKIKIDEIGINQTKIILIDNPELPLSKDFLLSIMLVDPHIPSVKIQQNQQSGENVAVISLFPNQSVEDGTIYTEMIFLVDLSYSMAGTKINNVKNTMELFLRSIPEGTLFNIVGFGTSHEFLFKKGSVEYNEKSLDTATQHVKKMQANLGGTNILTPLKAILNQKPKDGIPRQLFILTDGQVENSKDCFDFVKKNSLTTRIFTFGIGNDVDVDLVKGLAKSGNGFFEFVKDNEVKAIDGKVLKQLKRSLQPALTDLKIEWTPELKITKYSPLILPPLWGDSRLIIYAYLSPDSQPGSITISAKSVRGEFESGTFVNPSQITTQGDAVIKLAAKSIIKELEDNFRDEFKKEIIKVSIENKILSKYTSFVAVDKRATSTMGTLQIREITDNDLPKKQSSVPSFSSSSSLLSSITSRGTSLKKVSVGHSTSTSSNGIVDQMGLASSILSSVLSRRMGVDDSWGDGDDKGLDSWSSDSDGEEEEEEAAPIKAQLKRIENEKFTKSKIEEEPTKPQHKEKEKSKGVFFSEKKEEKASEKERDTKKDVEKDVVSDTVRNLILQQKSNGSFPIDIISDLSKISNKPLNNELIFSIIAKSSPNVAHTNDLLIVLISAVVIAIFSIKYADQQLFWDLVTNKTLTFIKKQKSEINLPNDLDLLSLVNDFVRNQF